MSSTKSNVKDIIISRITTTFFIFAVLSLLTWIYILPFKKHYLVINDYYQIIELVVIILTFIFMVFTLFKYFREKNKVVQEAKVITPSMLIMYSVPAFISAVVIPLSNNRTLMYKYCIAAFLVIFIAYSMYYLINKSFAYYAPICALYCVAFAFLDYMYSYDVTFSDKISLSYTAILIIFMFLTVLISALSYVISKKHKSLKFYYVLLFSLIALISLITRIFILRYVSVVAIVLEIVSFILISVIEKKGMKFKK